MNKLFPIIVLAAGGQVLAAAIPLAQSTVSQVINDVTITEMATRAAHPAKINDLFKAPDVLRTGQNSRAELTAPDQTITRVGANTIFSYEAKGRNINLEQGSLLFHSPKGRGGGTIKTGGASATVLGTTLIVSTTPNKAFKVIVLEGRASVTLPNGLKRILNAGQMTFVLPGGAQFAPVVNINLQTLVKGSGLVQGFPNPLPAQPRIEAAIAAQNKLLASGRAEDTGLHVGEYATENSIVVLKPNQNIVEKGIQLGEAGSEHVFGGPSGPTLPAGVEAAMRTDAVIASSLLDSQRVFSTPFYYSVIPGETRAYQGFVARNISFNTPYVDLSPYLTPDFNEFDFVAAGTIDFAGDLTVEGIGGLTHGDSGNRSAGFGGVRFSSKGGFNIVDSSIVNSIEGGLFFESGANTTLDTVRLENNYGHMSLETAGRLNFSNCDFWNKDGELSGSQAISLLGGSIQGSYSYFSADSGDVALRSGGNISLTGGDALGQNIWMEAGGNLEMYDFSLIANNGSIHLKAGDDLIINGSQSGTLVRNAPAPGPSGLASIYAQEMYLQARTVVFKNIDFPAGSSVYIQCSTGLLADNPNSGAPIVPGKVNYISSVTYNMQPAENFTEDIRNPGSGRPIQIRPIP